MQDAGDQSWRERRLALAQRQQQGAQVVALQAFEQVARRPQFDRLEQVRVVVRDGQHHHLDVGQGGFDRTGGFQAVAAWHLHVHQNDIRLEGMGLRLRVVTVAGCADHLKAAHGQQVVQPLEEQIVVIDQQQPQGMLEDIALAAQRHADMHTRPRIRGRLNLQGAPISATRPRILVSP